MLVYFVHLFLKLSKIDISEIVEIFLGPAFEDGELSLGG